MIRNKGDTESDGVSNAKWVKEKIDLCTNGGRKKYESTVYKNK